MTRYVLRPLPGLLALSVYLVLAAGAGTPAEVEADIDTGLRSPVVSTQQPGR